MVQSLIIEVCARDQGILYTVCVGLAGYPGWGKFTDVTGMRSNHRADMGVTTSSGAWTKWLTFCISSTNKQWTTGTKSLSEPMTAQFSDSIDSAVTFCKIVMAIVCDMAFIVAMHHNKHNII